MERRLAAARSTIQRSFNWLAASPLEAGTEDLAVAGNHIAICIIGGRDAKR
jgi:hypothetical protein